MLAWMNTRSWMALVMPITLTGLQALSVEMPMTVSTGRSCSWMARTMFSGAADVRRDRLEGEVLAGRHLLEGGGVEDDVGAAQDRGDAVEVAHVADAELEQLAEVVVDDLVGDGGLMQVGDAHGVLLGLVAREHDDLGGLAHLAAEQAADQHLAQRAGAAGDQHALALKRDTWASLHSS